MPDLSGKVAIVTGCASGIGAATVRRLRADERSGGAGWCGSGFLPRRDSQIVQGNRRKPWRAR